MNNKIFNAAFADELEKIAGPRLKPIKEFIRHEPEMTAFGFGHTRKGVPITIPVKIKNRIPADPAMPAGIGIGAITGPIKPKSSY